MAREYMDVEIRRRINQVEQQEECNNQNIYEGITINDVDYEFEETAFFDDKLKLHIPTTFFDMPLEFARIKYPSGERAQVIKTDFTGTVNITLNLTPNNLSDEQIPIVKDGLKNIFKRLNPSYLFYEEGVEIVEGKSVGYFEFKSPAVDEPLFNLIFLLELERNLIMGTFNCMHKEHKGWRPVARQIMQSVRVAADETVETPLAAGGRR